MVEADFEDFEITDLVGLDLLALALALDIATACIAEPFTDFPTIVGIKIDVEFFEEVLCFTCLEDLTSEEDVAFFAVVSCVFTKVLNSLNVSFKVLLRLP